MKENQENQLISPQVEGGFSNVKVGFAVLYMLSFVAMGMYGFWKVLWQAGIIWGASLRKEDPAWILDISLSDEPIQFWVFVSMFVLAHIIALASSRSKKITVPTAYANMKLAFGSTIFCASLLSPYFLLGFLLTVTTLLIRRNYPTEDDMIYPFEKRLNEFFTKKGIE
ncbi:hypothetical protein JMA_38950 (plasmid) [Jeotgalibacillus malaysiensis]|uniref:Uncharacterized protein n=1 Tax=Jeotgalibacillus malaysiensis TaxID=1508404 RepID=A0A0B5AXB7_9BACL|nr:hypothetical protein [Jeotgalibacillus malaysiensis]AJD93213.1 hypothetical protein JMA_38950 [Jeotgalibacillus malaysiensis]